MKTKVRFQTKVLGLIRAAASVPAAMFVVPMAHAQIAQVNQTMSDVQAILTGVAVTLFTIAIMWAGFKMAFQHAKWSEVSNIVIGGILVGGATAIAAWLI